MLFKIVLSTMGNARNVEKKDWGWRRKILKLVKSEAGQLQYKVSELCQKVSLV